MTKPNDPLRDRLLGQLPAPSDVAAYRSNVEKLFIENQKSVNRERIAVQAFWIFCAISVTAWLWFSAGAAQLPRAPFLACIFFTWGGVEVVKHKINASRVELLKEIKQLQLHVFSLDESLAGPISDSSRPPTC